MALRDKNKYNEYMRKYMLVRYHKRRELAIDKLGGKCVKCGTVNNLELDHVNKEEKVIDLARLWSCSLKRFYLELDKCQLLCSSCHEIKSILERGDNISKGEHGTLSSYKYCKCSLCKKAKSEYMRNYHRTHIRKRDREKLVKNDSSNRD